MLSYVNPEEKVVVTMLMSQKKYMRAMLTDEMADQMKKETHDPRDMLTKFMSDPYKELGKDTINGVEVRGIEVNNPPSVRGIYNNYIGRMWVDVATEYPVRTEIETETGTGEQKINDGNSYGRLRVGSGAFAGFIQARYPGRFYADGRSEHAEPG